MNGITIFVIPFMLYNGSDSINAKRKYVFVKPSVIIPLVSFGRTGYSLNTISDAAGGNEVQLNLPVDFLYRQQMDIQL